mgnify:CR=1 FL=1
MSKILTLNGMIMSKYESQAACAKTIGWSKQRLNRIVNGASEPTLHEVYELSSALDQPFMTVAQIFLPRETTNG